MDFIQYPSSLACLMRRRALHLIYTLTLVLALAAVAAAVQQPPASAAGSGTQTVDAGAEHTCAIGNGGALACWGANTLNQLDGVPQGQFKAVSAGGAHSCAIRVGGELACWGSNFRHQLEGIPDGQFKAVSAGGAHSCAIRADDELACWGDHGLGQFSGLPSGDFEAISLGGSHACGLRPGGGLACWGSNTNEQLDGIPTGPDAAGLLAVTAGGNHSCAIRGDGTIECWGNNTKGQLDGVPAGSFEAISAGGYYTCATRTDGTLACWGDASEGELDGVPSGSLHGVSSGGYHACGLPSAGGLECWGSIAGGQALPRMASSAPPSGTTGQPYAHSFATTPQSPTPAFSVIAGGLPPGLVLGSAGRLQGTPTKAGAYNFTVGADNGATPAAEQQVTLDIAQGPQARLLPVAGESFVFERTEGTVRIKCPGEDSFTGLVATKLIPVGCLIDTRKGTVAITASQGSSGELQTASFWAGIFRIDQKPGDNRRADVKLVGGLRCEKKTSTSGRVTLRRGGGGGRKLWGSGQGNYKTSGSYGSATVRGTIWLVQDRCDGSTLFKVKQGTVTVRDFVKKVTVTLEAGETYVAKASIQRLP